MYNVTKSIHYSQKLYTANWDVYKLISFRSELAAHRFLRAYENLSPFVLKRKKGSYYLELDDNTSLDRVALKEVKSTFLNNPNYTEVIIDQPLSLGYHYVATYVPTH